MVFIDYLIFTFYMAMVVGIGFYFFKKNIDSEDYYVGGRQISSHHIGLSIVTTDVGGGFSIGLGGLGYTMGLAGSWLLFTGLVGAWLSAVFIIPRIKKIDTQFRLMTYPDFLRFRFNHKVALLATIISSIGYLSFTGGQVLAGAKLFSATVVDKTPFGLTPLNFSLYTIGIIIIVYTVLGDLKAVIYTDTVQWIILLSDLILLSILFALHEIGGWSQLKKELPPEFFTLTNIELTTFINWIVIWLVAMTVYQRIYATKSVKDAKKAWYLAGFLEYLVMAFTGVILGMCFRVLFTGVEAELGLPLLIKAALPIGITGIVVASYFSAIMSTADSCLMASSGNIVNDTIVWYFKKNLSTSKLMRVSQLVTLVLGLLAVLLASKFATVLDTILYAYSFMVAGLFIPTLGAYFWKKSSSVAAFWSMIAGGTVTLYLLLTPNESPLGLKPSAVGIMFSAVSFVILTLLYPNKKSIEVKKSMIFYNQNFIFSYLFAFLLFSFSQYTEHLW